MASSKSFIVYMKLLPNILTLVRLLVIPAFVVFLMNPTPPARLWAAGIFLFASLTDWLDGYIARAYQAESILGTMLDPLADKILVMAALVMLTAVPYDPKAPAWMVVVLLSREMLVNGLRSVAAIKGVVVPASNLAKHKTAWTMIAILFLIVHQTYNVFSVTINFYACGMIFLWIALALSVVTGVAYAHSLRKMFL